MFFPLPEKLPDRLWAHPSAPKRPEHEADHSPLSSVEVKNEWRSTSTL